MMTFIECCILTISITIETPHGTLQEHSLKANATSRKDHQGFQRPHQDDVIHVSHDVMRKGYVLYESELVNPHLAWKN